MAVIGFGKFNRFYWLILFSTLLKISINILFEDMRLKNYQRLRRISINLFPVLNQHILIRFIYYYFGIFVLGSLASNTLAINKEFCNYEILKKKYKRAFCPILLVLIFYIMNEMINYYIDQSYLVVANFWVIQIIFIHLLLFIKEKLKLYSHQKLSFVIILILSFGTNFASTFFKQCEYQEYENIPNIPENIVTNIIENITFTKDEIIKKIIEEVEIECSNK